MKILICSDGSEQAERAMRVGAAIAVACRAETTLLGVIESPGEAKAILDSVKRGQTLLEEKGTHAELITKTGQPVEEIIRRTQEAAYDLVVIGAVRKTTRGLYWLSSKSYKIIKEVQPPVLSVVGQCGAPRRILICSGGKHYINDAVRLAGHIARCLGAKVTLLHVMPNPPAIYATLRRMKETATWLLNSSTELGVNLRRAKEMLDSMGVPVEVRLRQGSVLQEITRESRKGHYEMVVTGSALGPSLRTYVLGDLTREIVNHTTCAALVVRSREKPFSSRFSLRQFFGRLATK